MQVSTNWSVSHLRHWRPPVASSGYDLYRYTGRSWFKSKQSALRSILPNANIHHNEKTSREGTRTDSGCPCWCLLLTLGRKVRWTPVSPAGLHETAHAKQDWEDVGTWVYTVRVRMMAECLFFFPPCEKTGSRTKSRGKPNVAHCDNRKKSVVHTKAVDS